MSAEERDDRTARAGTRRAWTWRRRGRRSARATVLFDSRRKSDNDRTRAGTFDPTGAARHLIYRSGDNDIAVSAYLDPDRNSSSLSLHGQVLGPIDEHDSIDAHTEDGAEISAAIAPDGGFRFAHLPGRSVRLDHRRGKAVTTLGDIEVPS